MEQEEKYLGFLKYEGELVNEGFMDARKSAQALLGFDETVRFLIGQQAPELRKSDFDFPGKKGVGDKCEWKQLLNVTDPFNRAEVESWILCMQKAVDEQPYEESFKVYLIEQLRVPAERIFSACNI